MLSQEKIAQYKKRLHAQYEKLLKEIAEYERPVDFGSDDIDSYDEEADEAEEMANRLSVAQVKKDEAERIAVALTKIAEGSYGVCTNCGAEIPEKVLEAVLESTLCPKCKHEKSEEK